MEKEILEKVIDCAEGIDWNFNFYEDDNRFEFFKYSPAGQDFNFAVEAESLEELVDEIDKYGEDFDCSEHAYAWLDNTGHGKNGAPYDMKDVYEDMEACVDMMKELHVSLLLLLSETSEIE